MNFFTVSLERKKQSSQESKIEWVNVNVASENKREVEQDKVLVEVSSPSLDQFQTAGRWKFKKDWCKELKWLTFNYSTV
jgi:hypothetical protein